MYSGIWSRSSRSISRRSVRLLAGLVVLDDAARGERVEVDAVDLPGELKACRGRGRAGAPARSVRSRRTPRTCAGRAAARTRPRRARAPPGRARASARSSLRWRSVSSSRFSAPPAIASARHSPRNASASSSRSGDDALAAEPLRQAGEELEQRLVRDRAAHARVDLDVHRLRVEHALDEPDRRAVGESLELGDAERCSREPSDSSTAGCGEPGRPRGTHRARGRGGAPSRSPGRSPSAAGSVGGREPRDRPEPLAFARRRLERPDQLGERPPARHTRQVVRPEHGSHVLPERARLRAARRRRWRPRGRGRAGATRRVHAV